MEQLTHLLQSTLDLLNSQAVQNALATLAGVGALDMACRLVKTDKPINVLIGFHHLLEGVKNVLSELQALSSKVDSVITAVIPQRLKETAPAAPDPVSPPTDKAA